jgi:hypothetical protein
MDSYSKGESFLKWIATRDETWVHHYQPEIKWQNMQWKCPSFLAAKKLKTQPSLGKLMFIFI